VTWTSVLLRAAPEVRDRLGLQLSLDAHAGLLRRWPMRRRPFFHPWAVLHMFRACSHLGAMDVPRVNNKSMTSS
jgi:hypothetical protein